MDLKTIRKKLEDVSHMSQEMKNSYQRLSDNEKEEFKIGYHLDVEVDELCRRLFSWSEAQYEREHGEND
ncbi:hypothetical protein [Alkalicoccus urumqiensis]|uniref:Pathogenicity island protein n=1 Tax=Alkalicoccus urumqiensis TaxID=1548213 RepID=A0A2P6MKP4_ALKUR|nr:hypothetical protein [Alkalicoccus urumqiensis]PRO66857.1 hypothetical protein C6I21_02735 [Alkalicoccus urumqiensis]